MKTQNIPTVQEKLIVFHFVTSFIPVVIVVVVVVVLRGIYLERHLESNRS